MSLRTGAAEALRLPQAPPLLTCAPEIRALEIKTELAGQKPAKQETASPISRPKPDVAHDEKEARSSVRILVAEDNTVNRKLYQRCACASAWLMVPVSFAFPPYPLNAIFQNAEQCWLHGGHSGGWQGDG